MLESDKKRFEIISKDVYNPKTSLKEITNNMDVDPTLLEEQGYYVLQHECGGKTYYEQMSNESIQAIMKKANAQTVSEGISHFIKERFTPLVNEAGYDWSWYDFTKNGGRSSIFEAYLEPRPKKHPIDPKLDPKQNNLDMDNSDYTHGYKSQNTKRVDLLVKTVFQHNIPKDFELKTDAGIWKPVKDIKDDQGKVIIIWENNEVSKLKIETLCFPNDTNEIIIKVVNVASGEVLLDHKIEIYVIPTTVRQAEVFLRKVLFNQLKRWIDREVIRVKPFSDEYKFWTSKNPDFAYSFKSPNKNTILKDLINFVNTAQNPILDDFMEQNNLKHKQNYLRALLDSSEDAGIFQFDRDGNEIHISKGKNFDYFLDGKIRRVSK